MIWHTLGMLGAVFIVIAYAGIVSERWDSRSVPYLLINLIGAVLLIISLCFNFNLGSMLIEIFWVSISVAGLIAVACGKGGKQS